MYIKNETNAHINTNSNNIRFFEDEDALNAMTTTKELPNQNFGIVANVKDGIITILSLPNVKAGEIVYIQTNQFRDESELKSSLEEEEADDFEEEEEDNFENEVANDIANEIVVEDEIEYEDVVENDVVENDVEASAEATEATEAAEPFYLRALILNLNENNSQGILLGSERFVVEGALVFRSEELFRLNCSLSLFGQVLDALGENKMEDLNLRYDSSSLVEQKATGIIDREPVRIPLRTGLKALDSLVPIGRGQRELIIGDRQTGKTSVSLDIILNHVKLNNRNIFETEASNIKNLRDIVWFVYNAIGQKQSTINQVKTSLAKHKATWFTSIIASTAAEPAPLQFLSPYTACTLGEYIRDVVGGHCTIIFDDLSKHAVAYRQMSLLLRRPPGREAFPGDVFYVHSRLLERAGALTITSQQVRGTLTAFPVIETQAGDVSAYIPTNVISITDGQIFLETELFYRGIRPAVNVGLSVSRVGSAAQPGIMKRVAGSLKMELAQFREIEGFSKLGASLDEQTQRLLNRGENLIEILKQSLHCPLTTLEEVFSIYLGVGYNGSWLTDLQKRLKTSKRTQGLQLFGKIRARLSWLEWFRLLSPDFNLINVIPYISQLLGFITTLGLVKLNLNPAAENALVSGFKIFPLLLFDDVIFSFIAENSVLSKNQSGDLFANLSLLKLRYQKQTTTTTPVFSQKQKTGTANLNVGLKKFFTVSLLASQIFKQLTLTQEKHSVLFFSKFLGFCKKKTNKSLSKNILPVIVGYGKVISTYQFCSIFYLLSFFPWSGFALLKNK